MYSMLHTFIMNLCHCLLTLQQLKGALCRFGEEIQTLNFNIYSINEVITQTQKSLL